MTAGPKVASASFGLGQTPDQKIVNPTDTFKPDTPEIFLSFATSGVKSDTAVDATWVHVPSSSTLKGPTVRVSAPGEVTWGFSLMGDNESASLLIRRLDNGACSRAPGK